MDGTLSIVLLVVVVFAIVGALALRNVSQRKMAMRNLVRRKKNLVIVIGGLLVGTAIITSSLVVGDTLSYIFRNSIYQQLGEIDELIHTPGGNQSGNETGIFSYFNYSYYENLSVAKNQGELPSVDGLLPMVYETVPVMNPDTQLSEPSANLFGIDPQASRELGDLWDTSGSVVDEEGTLSVPGNAVINRRLADSVDAEEGHSITIFYTLFRFNISNPQVPDVIPMVQNLNVTVIVRNEGKGNFLGGGNIFVSLGLTQQMFERPGTINLIAVSNVGDTETGADKTDSAVSEIESVLAGIGGTPLEIETIKQDNLEFVETASEMITEVFSLMGTFSIVAGIILVINIFVMLAEERKPEMGISRALGMKRRHLVQMYVFEGSAYALIAAFIGTFAGLAIAYGMVTAFGSIFGAAGFEMPFYFEVDSLILGFCLGALITFLTVLLASWVVSRLNIVRAIRAIPEPIKERPSGRFVAVGALLVALGVLMFYGGIAQKSMAYFMTGPCLFLLGGGMIASRWVRSRAAYSVASAAILFWILAPIDWTGGLELESGMEMFVLSGLFLVLAAILLLMVNSTTFLNVLTRALARRRRIVPVIRIALSYPMKKKFRTGMTLGMFALIIFTVTVIAMITSFQRNSVESAFVEEAGSYDIIGFSNPSTPIVNISENISYRPSLANRFDEISSMSVLRVNVYAVEQGKNSSIPVALYGADERFFEENDFTFHSMMEGYDSPQEVWDAVRADPSLVVTDGSTAASVQYGPENVGAFRIEAGEELVLETLGVNKTVVGIVDESLFFQGIVMSDATLNSHFGARLPSLFFFTASDPDIENVRSLSKDLEREFLTSGMQTIVIRDVIQEFLEISSSIMNLFQVYLGLGLIVGIAGLGIITVRSVVERTNEIGVMRAIGYKRRMIRNTFILETSFVSITGITVGVLLGVGLSYYIYGDFFGEGATFLEFMNLIPYLNILLITLVALAFTLLATISSAFRAARIVPAEALRFKE
ncbi:MAG: FtsX-like permease family protein [Candidatus Thermoplasmatota archaeon]|nr:FtsX-like permease family protein [Candidatus Thermoplasmatota archaeon]